MHTSIFYSVILAVLLLTAAPIVRAQSGSDDFSWPEGKQAAVSLTFDDGRASQVKTGTALFNEHDVDVTFYVVPSSVEENLAEWKEAADAGHEIGNHSMSHPCTGNFSWSRDNALETYTLEQMRSQLLQANDRIEELLGVTPESFAYPCGQKFVGRGEDTKSYVPVVAELFTSGRGWLDEGPNDPVFCDFAQLTGMSMDASDFDEIEPLLDEARESGRWLVLAGHDIGQEGAQTTRTAMLEKLITYAQDPDNGIWLAPVGTITEYVKKQRE